MEGGEHEPGNNADDSEHDSLESRLIVRLYCKHGIYLPWSPPTIQSPNSDFCRYNIGVVKTHRLLLHSTELVMPSTSDSPDESRLTVAPKAIRDLIEHFPFPRGPKYDPKLIWKFEDQEIFLRGQDASLEAEGAILFLPFLATHDSDSFAHGKNRERLDHRTLPQCLRVRGIRRL